MAYDFFVDMAESTGWDASRNSALDALLDASLAITVCDLITPEQFDLRYESWASVVESSKGRGVGIVRFSWLGIINPQGGSHGSTDRGTVRAKHGGS